MSLELKDFRGRITDEADCVLEAESRVSGRDRQEIVREILHEWAMKRIHGGTVLHKLLRGQGMPGLDAGADGHARAGEAPRGSGPR